MYGMYEGLLEMFTKDQKFQLHILFSANMYMC